MKAIGRRLSLVLAVAVVGGALQVGRALAAPDHTVTVRPADRTASWDGTVAAVGANTSYSNEAGGPCPDEPAPDGSDFCDVTLVHVDVAPSFWDTHTGGVEIAIGGYDVPSSDFDLYVYRSDASGDRGAFVDDSADVPGAEEAVFVPRASGHFLVHVVYYTVVGSGYTGTATFAAAESGGGGGGDELPRTRVFFHDDGGSPTDGTFDTTAPTRESPAIAPGNALVGAQWSGELPEGTISTLQVDFWQSAEIGQTLAQEVDYEVSLITDAGRVEFPFFSEPAPATERPSRVVHTFTGSDPDSPLPLGVPGGQATLVITGHFVDSEALTTIHYDAVDVPSGFAVNVPAPARATVPPDVDEPAGLQEVLASDPGLGFTSHSEPHIAQSPVDPDVLVAGSKMYNRDPDALREYEFKIGTYVSFDRGRTWTDLGQLAVCPLSEAPPESWPRNTCYPEEDPGRDGPEDGGDDVAEEYITSDVWVQFDDEGNAYVMVLDHPPFDGAGEGAGWGMTLHRWESVSRADLETGQTWSERLPINAYDDEVTQALLLDDKNTFAVNNAGPDGDGRTGIMVACWGLNVNPPVAGKQQIVCERSTDGGRTWPDQPVPISDVQPLVIGVHVVADVHDPNTFYATWNQYATGAIGDLTPETLEFAVTRDGGLTWVRRPVPVTTFQGIPRRFPGQRFRNLTIPIMAVAPNGDLYIAYAEYLAAPDPATDEDDRQADILLVKSSDGGQTWGEPMNLTSDTGPGTNPNADQFQPYVALTESGQVNVAYFDRRLDLRTDDHSGNYFTDVFLSRSNDGGRTFTDVRLTHDATDPELNAPVSGSGLFFGDYQGLVVDDCWAIPFFNDTHLANDERDPGPVRDPEFDAGVPSSPYQEAVAWRVPNTHAYGGTLPAPCEVDLTVEELTARSRNRRVTLVATISNVGFADAPASTTRFLLDGPAVIGLVPTPAVPAGESVEVALLWDARGFSGTHVVTAVADGLESIEEVDEANNVATVTVRLRGGGSSGAGRSSGGRPPPPRAGAGPG